jgi:hypothetical protein
VNEQTAKLLQKVSEHLRDAPDFFQGAERLLGAVNRAACDVVAPMLAALI